MPVPILVPPVAFWNQFIVPVFAFAPKITVPFPHLDPFEVDVIIGVGLIVAITASLVAEEHPDVVFAPT